MTYACCRIFLFDLFIDFWKLYKNFLFNIHIFVLKIKILRLLINTSSITGVCASSFNTTIPDCFFSIFQVDF